MATPKERSCKENPGDFVGKGIITGKKENKKGLLMFCGSLSDKVTVISLDA